MDKLNKHYSFQVTVKVINEWRDFSTLQLEKYSYQLSMEIEVHVGMDSVLTNEPKKNPKHTASL
jgi:hypothetical protein